jgi:hypothetical protein
MRTIGEQALSETVALLDALREAVEEMDRERLEAALALMPVRRRG